MGYPCSKKRRKIFIKGGDYIPCKGFNNSMFILINVDENYNVDEYYNKNDNFIENKIKHIKLFKNGRMQITGCKSMGEIKKIFDIITDNMKIYIKYFNCDESNYFPHFIHINMYDIIYSLHKIENKDKFETLFNMRVLFDLIKKENINNNIPFTLSHNKKTIMPLKINLWIDNEGNTNIDKDCEASCLKIVIYKNGYIIITGGNSYEKMLIGKKKIDEFLDTNYNIIKFNK